MSSGCEATPIAEPWGDRRWKAGVLLSGDDARGDRPSKSLGEQLFDSRDAALKFAESEYACLGRGQRIAKGRGALPGIGR